MRPEIESILACPIDRLPLAREGEGWLACPEGHRHPVFDDVAFLLTDQGEPTMEVLERSRERVRNSASGDARAPELYLETLGLTEEDRQAIVRLRDSGEQGIDPVVQHMVAATCGMGYREAIGRLEGYPIPVLPAPEGRGRVLLDIGCNWGRWTFAAERAGYHAVGIDPQLGAVMAARRVARQLGSEATFICADARYLPFAAESVDLAFSYSVLQHFSDADCYASIREAARVLRSGGTAMIQLANALGVRSLYHQARRGLRAPQGFEVRYRMPAALVRNVAGIVGNARLTADCYLGLGLQASDMEILSPLARLATRLSEAGKAVSRAFPPFARLADGVYIQATKP